MKKHIKFIVIILIITVLIGIHQWHFKAPKDLLRDINSWEEIINAKNNQEIKEGIDNLNISTAYNDKRRSIEFLDICYAINDLESIKSSDMVTLAWLEELTQYLVDNNINEPKDCLKGKYLEMDSVKSECIFNEDDGIQNPYIALYILDKISDDRFNTSMKVLANFYESIYPVNSFTLLALHDKNTGIFKNKSYCDQIVKQNYESFRRNKEDNIHTYTDELEEDLNQENEVSDLDSTEQ